MDFQDALTSVIAELTPQPWDYTTPDGTTTLTVIPAGLREDPGRAEVMIRISNGGTPAAEIGIRSADMPGLLAALDAGTSFKHRDYDELLRIVVGDGIRITVVDSTYYAVGSSPATATVTLPAVQRLPLASALRRALDVARGWES